MPCVFLCFNSQTTSHPSTPNQCDCQPASNGVSTSVPAIQPHTFSMFLQTPGPDGPRHVSLKVSLACTWKAGCCESYLTRVGLRRVAAWRCLPDMLLDRPPDPGSEASWCCVWVCVCGSKHASKQAIQVGWERLGKGRSNDKYMYVCNACIHNVCNVSTHLLAIGVK